MPPLLVELSKFKAKCVVSVKVKLLSICYVGVRLRFALLPVNSDDVNAEEIYDASRRVKRIIFPLAAAFTHVPLPTNSRQE
jgi:hypothetical protein